MIAKVCGFCAEPFDARINAAKFCSRACYYGSRKGARPWNKDKTCPELTGDRNGMFGRTHTEETRRRLSRATSSHLSTLTRELLQLDEQLRRSDPRYVRLFRLGWRRIREQALERDGHACTRCGATESLNVHHTTPFSVVLRHELHNLITLCTRCHGRVHRGLLVLDQLEAVA